MGRIQSEEFAANGGQLEFAIEVKDLHKVYRPPGGKMFVALRGLDLQVPVGSVYGFVGPNGAGKSTTIKALIGLLRPTSGQALVLGKPCGSVEARSAMGYLPEVAVYHEFMNADELLAIHAGLAGLRGQALRDKCKAALELVSLWDRRKSRIREFSKGMKQRFGIAQALVAEPHLLILDELTSGLDPLAQAELRHILLELKGRGHTILFSSHKMSEVESVSDWIGIVHKGKMRLAGSKKELLQSGQECLILFDGETEVPEELVQKGIKAERDEASSLRKWRGPKQVAREALDWLRQAGVEVVEFSLGRRHLEEVFLDIVTRPVAEEAA